MGTDSLRAIVIVATVALISAACSASGPETRVVERSDRAGITVVNNAEVYTVDADQPWAEAFAYDADGVITAVGSEAAVLAMAGDNPVVIDAGARMVMPGFQDPHVHVPEAGLNNGVCLMPAGLTLGDYEDLAFDCAESQPDSNWVRAAGPSLFGLNETAELPIDVLDRAIPDRPALILDDLGHAIWTNSLGLAAAGIGPDDPDPRGGIFQRDPTSGRLTGLILEDAQQLVRNAAAADDETTYEGLLIALSELARNGITAVSDAGGFWGQNHPAAWQRALEQGTLTVRAANSLYLYPDMDIDAQLLEFERRFDEDSEMLRFDTAKIYIDGIVDLGTASLLEPYEVPVNPSYPTGFSYFRPDDLRTYVSALHAIGYRMSFHAIGDAAVREALDAVESIDDNPSAVAARRHRTTHTYLVHPEDLNRFAELGVVADVQQSPDAIDPAYHQFLASFVGDIATDLIPTAALLDAGASVTLSSDWDAGPLSPLGTIRRALTRDTNAVPDLVTAIELTTIDAAYALGFDDISGSITVGKYADFVILDQNLFDVDFGRIDETRVMATYVAGIAVYSGS